MESLHGSLSSLSHSPTSVSAELFSQRNLDLSKSEISQLTEKLAENPLDLEPSLPESTLQVLLEKETTAYSGQCLQGFDKFDQSLVFHWFRSMTKWCYTVADRCELPPVVVEAALTLLDRFLICSEKLSSQSEILHDSKRFQLVTMTCLYIASKTIPTASLTPGLLQRMSRNTIRAEDIEAMELEIVFDLDFQINPPTILSFAQAYAQDQLVLWNFDVVEGSEEDQHQRSFFLYLVNEQARVAVSELYTLSVPISVIALACVKNALQVMENYGALPPIDTPFKEIAYSIAMLNLQAKVRRSSKQRKPEFESQQDQLKSSLLPVALQARSTFKRASLEDIL